MRILISLAILATSTPVFGRMYEVGEWAILERFLFDDSSCTMTHIQGDKAILISYSGSKRAVQIIARSIVWNDYEEQAGRFSISFSPLPVEYKGKGSLKTAKDDQNSGRPVEENLQESQLKVVIDNPLILHDLARQRYLRISNASGDIATQFSLAGSSVAVSELRRCVDRQMSKL